MPDIRSRHEFGDGIAAGAGSGDKAGATEATGIPVAEARAAGSGWSAGVARVTGKGSGVEVAAAGGGSRLDKRYRGAGITGLGDRGGTTCGLGFRDDLRPRGNWYILPRTLAPSTGPGGKPARGVPAPDNPSPRIDEGGDRPLDRRPPYPDSEVPQCPPETDDAVPRAVKRRYRRGDQPPPRDSAAFLQRADARFDPEATQLLTSCREGAFCHDHARNSRKFFQHQASPSRVSCSLTDT